MAVALRELEQQGPARPPRLRLVDGEHGGRRPPRRMFWLRRLLVLAVAVGMLAGGVTIARSLAVGAPVETISVAVVIPEGGTLWDLAGRYAPDGADRSAWVVDVAERNDLDPAAILPGTVVSVPVQASHVTASPTR